jgi:NAD(P)-dependent dehydrogenase (short-subunit alcohol dehydrogenase family)
MDFAGRVIVITGIAGGLGKAAARAFADHGATLVAIGSDQSKLDALFHDLGLPIERWLAVAADLRDPDAVRAAAQAVTKRFGVAHILVHLVGGWTGGKEIVATDARELQTMLEQHVWTTFHLLQAFTPLLMASGWGRVIGVSSPLATNPAAKMSAYAAAKAAEESLIFTWAQEVKAHGVTANIVEVRSIDVDHKRPLGQFNSTTPEEIVAAMFYLCSLDAGIVTGTRLWLSGG